VTPKERRQLVLNTAKIENKHLLTLHGGRTPNYGLALQPLRGGGTPRLSEIGRSGPAQRLLKLAEQGFSLAEAARITSMSVEEVISKSNRYQIKFNGSDQGYGQG